MKKILAIAVATAISAPAMADLTIGGDAEYVLSAVDGSDATSAVETNLNIAASTTSESGLTVGAFTQIEATGVDGQTVQLDDIYLTLGNAMATVTLAERGGFATKDAFALGADTAAQISSYGASTTERKADVAVDFTVADVAVQVAGNIGNSTGTEKSIHASTTVGDVSVAASYEDFDTGTGFAVSASTVVSEVTLGVAYAADDSDNATSVLSAAYGDLTVQYANGEGATDASDIYGEYKITLAPGATLKLAAGNYDGDTSKVAAKINYAF